MLRIDCTTRYILQHYYNTTTITTTTTPTNFTIITMHFHYEKTTIDSH